jgi:hypothetical protein
MVAADKASDGELRAVAMVRLGMFYFRLIFAYAQLHNSWYFPDVS